MAMAAECTEEKDIDVHEKKQGYSDIVFQGIKVAKKNFESSVSVKADHIKQNKQVEDYWR